MSAPGRRFGEQLRLLHAGEIGFDAFSRATASNWSGLGRFLLRKWHVPAGVGLEDVVQELLVGAWRAVPKYDAKKSSSLERYVVWCACDKAKKFIHKQRGAILHGNADSAPSRIAAPFSAFARDGEDDSATVNRFTEELSERAGQEEQLEFRQARAQALAQCRSARERLALEMLIECEGSVERAAAALYDDPRTRLAMRFGNEVSAIRVVRRAYDDLVVRVEGAA